jgi:dienelactone hydrolase
MRYYLDPPLVIGYALMATIACLGMLQFAAARGGYRGLSLFVANPKNGKRVGAALVIAAVLGYVMFAPEILTPGPAGSEVAFMFALCALAALSFTLLGADLRIRRLNVRQPDAGRELSLADLTATLYYPSPPHEQRRTLATEPIPPIVLLPDPSGFVVLPAPAIDAFTQAGMAVLVVDTSKAGSPPPRHSLARHTSDAIQLLSNLPGVDTERIGLLGLGLSGDAILAIAPRDARFTAAIALSSVNSAPLSPGATARGLDWLRELSYLQVWRWRRLCPGLRQAVVRLHSEEMARDEEAVPVRHASLNSRLIAMRKQAGSVVAHDTPNERYFTLLEEDRVEKLVVQWFHDALVDDA